MNLSVFIRQGLGKGVGEDAKQGVLLAAKALGGGDVCIVGGGPDVGGLAQHQAAGGAGEELAVYEEAGVAFEELAPRAGHDAALDDGVFVHGVVETVGIGAHNDVGSGLYAHGIGPGEVAATEAAVAQALVEGEVGIGLAAAQPHGVLVGAGTAVGVGHAPPQVELHEIGHCLLMEHHMPVGDKPLAALPAQKNPVPRLSASHALNPHSTRVVIDIICSSNVILSFLLSFYCFRLRFRFRFRLRFR